MISEIFFPHPPADYPHICLPIQPTHPTSFNHLPTQAGSKERQTPSPPTSSEFATCAVPMATNKSRHVTPRPMCIDGWSYSPDIRRIAPPVFTRIQYKTTL